MFGFLMFCLVMGAASYRLCGADIAKPTPPTPEQRITLLKLAKEALIADNALKQAALDYMQRDAAQKKAMDAYEKARNEAAAKAGCSLDADFNCAPSKEMPEAAKPAK